MWTPLMRCQLLVILMKAQAAACRHFRYCVHPLREIGRLMQMVERADWAKAVCQFASVVVKPAADQH
jgi:hypothetical protein